MNKQKYLKLLRENRELKLQLSSSLLQRLKEEDYKEFVDRTNRKISSINKSIRVLA